MYEWDIASIAMLVNLEAIASFQSFGNGTKCYAYGAMSVAEKRHASSAETTSKYMLVYVATDVRAIPI